MPRTLRSGAGPGGVRAVRGSSAAGRRLLEPVLRFRRRWLQSNVAYFIVCSPTPPTEQPSNSYLTIARMPVAPREARGCAQGQYIVLARSNADMHSEARAAWAFRHYFGERARITFVFSEREPCHEGRGGCRGLLERLLRTYGRDGTDTPVRYLYGYLNAEEIAAGAVITSTPRRVYRRQQRGWAQQGIRASVRDGDQSES